MRWQFDPAGRLLLPLRQRGRVRLSNGHAAQATLLQSRQHKTEPSEAASRLAIHQRLAYNEPIPPSA